MKPVDKEHMRLRGFRYWHETVLAAMLAGLLILARLLEPGFLTLSVQIDLSTHVWELALLALPMTLIIITAGIDLSVGATMGLCAVVLGLSYEAGISPWLGALLALLTGLVAGAVNGVFVVRVRVHPLIVTLATLAAYRGIAEGISLGRPISGFPASFTTIGQDPVLGVPIPGAFFVVAALCAAIALARMPFGRRLYAIGHSEAVSRLAGIAVGRIKLWIYTLSGAAAAVAAIFFVARRNTAKADAGMGMELDVITAVVLGGTSIFGGRGRIVGTLLGVMLIHEAREFVTWRWNKAELNLIVIGTLLIVSVLLHGILERGKKQ